MSQVTTTIPALVGWESSRPDRGRYLWRGDASGVTKVKIRDKSATLGIISVQLSGKFVPDADTLDVINFYADVELTMDGHCGGGTY